MKKRELYVCGIYTSAQIVREDSTRSTIHTMLYTHTHVHRQSTNSKNFHKSTYFLYIATNTTTYELISHTQTYIPHMQTIEIEYQLLVFTFLFHKKTETHDANISCVWWKEMKDRWRNKTKIQNIKGMKHWMMMCLDALESRFANRRLHVLGIFKYFDGLRQRIQLHIII